MAEKIEAGEEYRGPCGVLKDSNWLSAETIPADRDTILQIEKVVRRKTVEFRQPGKKAETKHGYGSLKFVGKERELGLNVTNLRVLSALFGPDTSKWFGQRIALYVDPAVSAFGQIVSAVRIRAKHVDPPKSQPTNSKDADADPERAALLTRIKHASAMLKLTPTAQQEAWRQYCGTGKPEAVERVHLLSLCEALEAQAMQGTGDQEAYA